MLCLLCVFSFGAAKPASQACVSLAQLLIRFQPPHEALHIHDLLLPCLEPSALLPRVSICFMWIQLCVISKHCSAVHSFLLQRLVKEETKGLQGTLTYQSQTLIKVILLHIYRSLNRTLGTVLKRCLCQGIASSF